MMQITETDIAAVKVIEPRINGDQRGFFSEVYNATDLAEFGIDLHFVQDNHSYSADSGVVRGLHFQRPPYAQDKLVRVIRGRIWDVAVDLRRKSNTFGKYVAVELSRDNWRQLLIPIGFAHGFVTLDRDTEVIYKVTEHYSAAHDAGIDYADPEVAVPWPIDREKVIVSGKDKRQPSFAEFRGWNPF